MATINTILKELKEVPINRLEELYQFVHALTPKGKHNAAVQKKILSFAGSFSDMSDTDYADFINQTKKARAETFTRNTDV